jgi:hypothetical protein
MAIFKIESCHPLAQSDTAEFVVQFREGQLAVGDSFLCYDTHHPVLFKVVRSIAHAERVQLICTGLLFAGQFTNAVVNTSIKERPGAFRYEHSADPA